MCLWFDSCFGVVHDCDDDDYRSPSAKGHNHTVAVAVAKTTLHQPPPPAQRNEHYYSHAQAQHGHHQAGVVHPGNGHRARHHQPVAAAGEADRKASYDDVRRGPAPAAAKDGRGYAASAQEKAGAARCRSIPRGTTGSAMAQATGRTTSYEPAAKDDATGYHYHTAAAAMY